MKKILFCQVGGVGDIVQTTNILKVFKRRDPECEITYATTTPYQQLMEGINLADKKAIIPTTSRHDSFHGTGKGKMEKYIQNMSSNFDEIYFPQAAFHRDLLIKKNGWQVVKTMFELCGITDYPTEPFDVAPKKVHIDTADKWLKERELLNRKIVFIEAESYSGQSFVHSQQQMCNIMTAVANAIPNDVLAFVIGAKRVTALPRDERFFQCELPLLCLLEIFKMTSIFISPHSGLINLFACEHCFSVNKPTIAIMYDWQAPISIGPEGYPVIKQMKYIYDETEETVVERLVEYLRGVI